MKNGNYKLTELLKGDKMKRILFLLGFMMVLLAPLLSEAALVTINNYSFEDDFLTDGSWQVGVSGWDTVEGVGVYSAGAWNPYQAYNFNSGITGSNVAWVNADNAYLYQTIANYSLSADTILTLSVDVGWRLDLDMIQPGYTVALLSGNTLLAYDSSTALTKGQFVTSTVSYSVLADNSLIGQPVSIVLSKIYGTQVNFDNVRLNNDSISRVPEPSTLILLGAGLLGFGVFASRRRK